MRIILAALAILLTFPALAQTCVSVEQDRVLIEAKGWIWLGLRRAAFTDGVNWVYYKVGQFTAASPVVDGCVLPQVLPIGVYVDEAEV